MPKELKKNLFIKVCKSTTGGMGIFLKISKYLMETFNGDIKLIRSEINKGTEMMLWLPKSMYME